MGFLGDAPRGLDIGRGGQGRRTSFPNDGGAPSPASRVLVGVRGRAATRIRASRERSGPCARCADAEVSDPRSRPAWTRFDDFRLGAVYRLATRTESRQHAGWASWAAVVEHDPVRRSCRFANDVLACNGVRQRRPGSQASLATRNVVPRRLGRCPPRPAASSRGPRCPLRWDRASARARGDCSADGARGDEATNTRLAPDEPPRVLYHALSWIPDDPECLRLLQLSCRYGPAPPRPMHGRSRGDTAGNRATQPRSRLLPKPSIRRADTIPPRAFEGPYPGSYTPTLHGPPIGRGRRRHPVRQGP